MKRINRLLIANDAPSAATAPAKRRAYNSAFTFNAAGTKHAKFEGRDHLVAPAVVVKEGVLNGMLVLFDEFAAYPTAWEGVPLPIYHPHKGTERVSANTPDVLEKQVVGRMFNIQADATARALKGEFWIDVVKANGSDDGKEIIRRLEAGEDLEVSTGYFSDLELATGTHNGKAYDAIQRNMRPDHVALLPDKKGACSWADGCGAPRVNVPAITANDATKYLLKDAAGIGAIPITNKEGKLDHGMMTAAARVLCNYEGPGKAKALAQLKGMFRKEKLDMPSVNVPKPCFCLSANSSEYSHDDIDMMLRESLAEEDGSNYYYLQDVYDDFLVYMAESKTSSPAIGSTQGLYKRAYSILDGAITLGDPIPVVRQTSYVEVENEEHATMDKKAMVDKLIADSSTPWKEDDRVRLMAINEASLAKLLPADPAVEAAAAALAKKTTTVNSLISDQRTTWKEEDRAALLRANQSDLDKLMPADTAPVEKKTVFANTKEFMDAIPDAGIRRMIEQGLAANERRKGELVAALVANKSCKFLKEELLAMDVEFLEKVADSMSVSYVGAAPPRHNDRARVENEDQVPDPPQFLTAPVQQAK